MQKKLGLALFGLVAWGKESVVLTPALTACRVDAECIKVELNCDQCCHEGAIAAQQKKNFDLLYVRECQNYRGGACDCAPAPAIAHCRAGHCVLRPAH